MDQFKLTEIEYAWIREDQERIHELHEDEIHKADKSILFKIGQLFDLATRKSTTEAKGQFALSISTRDKIVDILCDIRFGKEGFWKSAFHLNGSIII